MNAVRTMVKKVMIRIVSKAKNIVPMLQIRYCEPYPVASNLDIGVSLNYGAPKTQIKMLSSSTRPKVTTPIRSTVAISTISLSSISDKFGTT